MNWLLVLFVASIACNGEIIDRVAVVLGNSVITESEILREIRLTAFLNGAPLDFGAASKRKTAERLVEQHLIAAEAKSAAYPAPDPEGVEQLFQTTRDRFPGAANFKAELDRAGIGENELKGHLSRQIATLSFLDYRFRPGIQINDDEIAKYFHERVEPALKKAHPGRQFSVEDSRSQIEEILINQRLDAASDEWLKEARERTRIEYRAEVFASEPARQEAVK